MSALRPVAGSEIAPAMVILLAPGSVPLHVERVEPFTYGCLHIYGDEEAPYLVYPDRWYVEVES